jgi:hypothetical protein
VCVIWSAFGAFVVDSVSRNCIGLLTVDNNCVYTNELNTKNRGLAKAVTRILTGVAKKVISALKTIMFKQDSRLVSNALYCMVF